MESSAADVTQLLAAWTDWDKRALDALMPIVYAELRRLARSHIRRERAGHSPAADGLGQRAYIRLIDYKRMQWQNRARFFGVSAQLIRRILVDQARRHNLKRGGNIQHAAFDHAQAPTNVGVEDIVVLDAALSRLASFDERMARVVELRFFGGLSVEETAEVLKVSAITVMRDRGTARAWLYRELTGGTGDEP